MTWMELVGIMLDRQRQLLYNITYMCNLRIGPFKLKLPFLGQYLHLFRHPFVFSYTFFREIVLMSLYFFLPDLLPNSFYTFSLFWRNSGLFKIFINLRERKRMCECGGVRGREEESSRWILFFITTTAGILSSKVHASGFLYPDWPRGPALVARTSFS